MTRRLGVDVGGTFTDLVAIAPDGGIAVHKVATTPRDPAKGLFRAVDDLRRAKPDAIDVLVHGTTVATNALLERRGARTALVTTSGFEDVLWLRRQDRASLYDLALDHPPPLVTRDRVIAVAERMAPGGPVVALEAAEVERVVEAVRALDVQAVAVVLLFAFRHPAHEARLAAALRAALPGVAVVASHEVLPVFREYERASTTLAEAYLRPVVGAYVARTADGAARRGIGTFRVMTSSGGSLAPAAAATHSATLALSGPAGGVVGARLLGAAVGRGDLLTLDMGGTSADASLVTGGVALAEQAAVVGGVPLALPAILIETVSAGGGSIARIDEGGALKVGPESAGADPGPAAYGRGAGAPTVTDACLALGWLDPGHPLADDVRLDRAAAERALGTLIPAAGPTVTAAARGVVTVAAAVMARALKRVSVARGVDPRRTTLVPFGGAGPLFGCALATALGIREILIPPHPGVLSALGLAAAPERVDILGSLHRRLADLTPVALREAFAPLAAAAATALPAARLERAADCRFSGQGYELTVSAPADEPMAVADAFVAAHRARFGHGESDWPIEVVNLRVAAIRPGTPVAFGGAHGGARPVRAERRIHLPAGSDGAASVAAVWSLGALPAGWEVCGPAVLVGPDATGLVEPGWRGVVHETGTIVLRQEGA